MHIRRRPRHTHTAPFDRNPNPETYQAANRPRKNLYQLRGHREHSLKWGKSRAEPRFGDCHKGRQDNIERALALPRRIRAPQDSRHHRRYCATGRKAERAYSRRKAGARAQRKADRQNLQAVRGCQKFSQKAASPAKQNVKLFTETTLDTRRILELLPHRYPFVLIDRVVETRGDAELTAIKNVTINEPFFMGHFPGNPGLCRVYCSLKLWRRPPGIMMLRHGQREDKLAYFMSADKVKFLQSYQARRPSANRR